MNGHLNVGGVERSLLDILCHLDYGRYDVDLLLLEDQGDYINEVPPEVRIIFRDLTNTYGSVATSLCMCIARGDWLCFGMRLIILLEKKISKRFLKLAGKLLLGHESYDCAVGFRVGICTDLVAYAVNARRKLTWWHHGELNIAASKLDGYEKTFGLLDHVVSVSSGCLKLLEQSMPAVSSRLLVIPNMLDVEAVREKAKLLQPYHGYPEHRLVTVGRLSPEKHIENAVRAAERLVQEGVSGFRWHVVGDGSEMDVIEKLIRDRHLEDFLSLEGSQTNPYPYVKHATLYVHTSYVESQGLSILEAMALGVPCIVTRSLGPEEYIRNGENGILVEQNVDSLADAILEVIGKPGLYETLCKNTRCPPQYCCENVMQKIETLMFG